MRFQSQNHEGSFKQFSNEEDEEMGKNDGDKYQKILRLR
jgi:hypothetical protein